MFLHLLALPGSWLELELTEIIVYSAALLVLQNLNNYIISKAVT